MIRNHALLEQIDTTPMKHVGVFKKFKTRFTRYELSRA